MDKILIDKKIELNNNTSFITLNRNKDGLIKEVGNIDFLDVKNFIKDSFIKEDVIKNIDYFDLAKVGQVGLNGGYIAYKSSSLIIEVHRKVFYSSLSFNKINTSSFLGEGVKNLAKLNLSASNIDYLLQNGWVVPTKEDIANMLDFIKSKFSFNILFTSSITPDKYIIIYDGDFKEVEKLDSADVILCRYYRRDV